ncbi:hypothetical protein Bbelb_277990 [Branchiostoma belcheri]|nr:hypothetical protein Bbelb_277990 [Branchiostoma belcheri]
MADHIIRTGSPGYVGPHEHPGQTGPTGPVGHGPTRPFGKTGPHLLMGPPWLPGPPGTPGQPESSSCPVGPQKHPKEKGPIRSVSHCPTGPSGPLGKTGAQGALPGAERICLLSTNLAEVAEMSGRQQQTSNTGGAMTRQQPETDWISVADAGANISNPMYFTGSGYVGVHEHPGEMGPKRFVSHGPTGPSGPLGNTGPHRLMSPPGPLGQPRISPYPSMPAEHSQPFGKSMSNEPYIRWQGTCYKIFNTQKNFIDANETCHRDNGTLAMPRDAETNDFLASLKKSGSYPTWLGLHDKREEGRFEWMDGSPLGKYNSWHPGQPNDRHVTEDCVFMHVGVGPTCGQWWDDFCWRGKYFFCQVALETGLELALPGAGRVYLLSTNLAEVAEMSGGQQQSQTADTGATTPRQQPGTDWSSVADAGANISNPMYFTGSVVHNPAAKRRGDAGCPRTSLRPRAGLTPTPRIHPRQGTPSSYSATQSRPPAASEHLRLFTPSQTTSSHLPGPSTHFAHELASLVRDILEIPFVRTVIVGEPIWRLRLPPYMRDFHARVREFSKTLRPLIDSIPNTTTWRHCKLWQKNPDYFVADGLHLSDFGNLRYYKSIRYAILPHLPAR